MLSERQLSRGFAAWWIQVAPGLNGRWLTDLCLGKGALAASIDQWAAPIHSALPPRDNDLVAETAFGLFALANRECVPVSALETSRISEVVHQATLRIMMLRASGRDLHGLMTEEHVRFAATMAARLQNWLATRGGGVEVQPRLPGMGVIDSCHPDFIVAGELIEVKMAQALFRLSDVRQVLVYSALMWHCSDRSIEHVTLANPRLGITWRFRLTDLIREISGRTPSLFFRDLDRLSCELGIPG